MGDDAEADTDIGGQLGRDVDSAATLLGHYYRAELDRMNTEQSRVDQTTQWAITILAAILAYAFSSGDRPHYILLIGVLTLGLFHLVETRRYRAYDAWRARVRLVEENLLAPTLDPGPGVEHEDWRQELGTDLRHPARKIPFVEAYARRLRRVYLPLLLVLVGAWAVRILIVAPGGSSIQAAAVAFVPGWLVVVSVTGFLLAALLVAFWPRERRAKGEFHERDTEGDWKDDAE